VSGCLEVVNFAVSLAPETQHCMVCAAPLHYGTESVEVVCHDCGRAGVSSIVCPDGHYVCDRCHAAASLEWLKQCTLASAQQSPEALLEELLALPGLPMHGPEHHVMAALALLGAARNKGREVDAALFDEALRRGMTIPGGACGYLGACGAGVGVGIAVSLLQGATPTTEVKRGLANRATAAALIALGDDYARCCKRVLRLAVAASRPFLKTHLGLDFPLADAAPLCNDMARNRECPGRNCLYHPLHDSTGETR